MAEKGKYNTIEGLLGSELTPDMLNDMIIEGRISFPFKPTTTSAISTAGDQKDSEDDLDDYLNRIKNNEDLLKQLEDMRDDMLSGMRIPPANEDISDAAKKLGSVDGIIDKAVFDNAEAILDPDIFIPNQIGNAVDIGALIGDSNITGDFVPCNEVTKGICDSWKITGQDDGATIEGDKAKAKNSVQKAKQQYKKKLWDMFIYIFKMLWWNEIWPRVVIFHMDMIERIIAIPIDIPFLILRFFKKFTKKNFYKYGPVHRLINKLKIYLLCNIPRACFTDYDPRREIVIFYNDKMTPVVDMCKVAEGCPECKGKDQQTASFNNDDDGDVDGFPTDQDKAKDMQTKTRDKLNNEMPAGDVSCIPMKIQDLFSQDKPIGPGLPPNCVEAAKIVLDAVYEDGMKFGDYDGLGDEALIAVKGTLSGSIKDAMKDGEK